MANYLTHWSRRYRYIYFETPKAGCTTIKRLLQLAEVGNDPQRLGADVHDRASSPLLRPFDAPDAFACAMQDPDTLKFCFVRHPCTRILSGYLDKIVNATTASKGVRRRHLLGLYGARVPSFEEFLRAIRQRGCLYDDIHWAPQSWLLNPSRIRYDFVGRFETIQSDLRRLCDLLGITPSAAELASGRRHATQADRKIAAYLHGEAGCLMRQMFAEDFRQFNYA